MSMRELPDFLKSGACPRVNAITKNQKATPEPSVRKLPDFLKQGDPALTFARGKEYGPNYPKGRERLAWPVDPCSAREIAVREWLALVAAGKIG